MNSNTQQTGPGGQISSYICPNTSTPAATAAINQSNSQVYGIMQPIADNRQNPLPRPNNPPPGTDPLTMTAWWVVHTSPNDPTTSQALYRQNPQALAQAQVVQYPPQGNPVSLIPRPWGYQVEGKWHIGYWDERLGQRLERANPDVNPV